MAIDGIACRIFIQNEQLEQVDIRSRTLNPRTFKPLTERKELLRTLNTYRTRVRQEYDTTRIHR